MSLPDAQRAKFLAWAADRWRADAYRHTSETSGEWDAWQAAIASQAAELEAMRADAERYRWLRQQHWYEAALCVVVNPKNAVKLGHDCPSLERLDAAIDAARAALSQPTAQPAGGERERYEFVLAQCREAQDIAASRGWALSDIATASTTDPRARKIATEALLGGDWDVNTGRFGSYHAAPGLRAAIDAARAALKHEGGA